MKKLNVIISAMAAAAFLLSVPAASQAQTSTDLWVCDYYQASSIPDFFINGSGTKCQKTAAKMGSKFLKIKLKTDGKCRSKQEPGRCPTAKGVQKIEKVATKASAKINKICDHDAVHALVNAYADIAHDNPEAVASCTLGQHNALAEIFIGITHGTPGIISNRSGRAGCVKALGKAAIKYATTLNKAVNKCLSKNVGSDTCIGSHVAGSFVAPTEPKAAALMEKARAKAMAGIDKKCSDNPDKNITASGPNGYISSIFACPGATTTEDLKSCVACSSRNFMFEAANQQYSEDAVAYINDQTPGGIQGLVDTVTAGNKVLIGSGTYAEEVVINNDIQVLVGCGAATNDRPLIVPPSDGQPHISGILAANSSSFLLFQGLEINNFDENGIFVSGASQVTFRDLVTDGDGTYGVFPVQSSNVLIEACKVTNTADAGIYVGQSSDIVVRYNTTEYNVAGIEIENSTYASVHNNYTANNTGGLMIFKLPNLPVQSSGNHDIFANVIVNNNTVNFCAGGLVCAIPDGTGMLVISNQDSDIHHNLISGNNSFGMALVDQNTLNALAAPDILFATLSPDSTLQGNSIRYNVIMGNGAAPDATPPNATPLSADLLYAHDGVAGDNCFTTNAATVKLSFMGEASAGFPGPCQ
ncbi:MAG: parallel beta-helix domain-containing protein [Deltaproteobacteria bacterium]